MKKTSRQFGTVTSPKPPACPMSQDGQLPERAPLHSATIHIATATTSRPWLDKHGEPVLFGRLKQRSKTWPIEVWQLYCEYLESEESHSSESRISSKTIEEELEGMTYEIDECLEGPKDFSKLHLAINSLSFVQRTVIQKVFWAGQTVREIAHEMRLSRSTVQDLKSAALTKLYAKIPDTSPFIRGEVVFLTQNEGRKRAA